MIYKPRIELDFANVPYRQSERLVDWLDNNVYELLAKGGDFRNEHAYRVNQSNVVVEYGIRATIDDKEIPLHVVVFGPLPKGLEKILKNIHERKK